MSILQYIASNMPLPELDAGEAMYHGKWQYFHDAWL